MAAGIAARLVDVRKSVIRESCLTSEYWAPPGIVSRVHGVDYINDSKATNVNSTWYALESMTTPTVWIVGGVDKGNDYEMLNDLVKQKVKAIVCLGTTIKKLFMLFQKSLTRLLKHNRQMMPWKPHRVWQAKEIQFFFLLAAQVLISLITMRERKKI